MDQPETTTPARQRWVRLAAVLVMLAVAVVPIFPAQAAVNPTATAAIPTQQIVAVFPHTEAGGGGRGGNSQCASDTLGAANSHLLPVNRWNDATSDFHTRTSSGDIFQLPNMFGRSTILGGVMSFGNFLYASSSAIITAANGFCVLDRVGGSLDHAAASFGTALFNSPLMAGLFVAGILGVFFTSFRNRAGQPLFKALGSKVLIVALFGLMLAGAQASTGGTGGVFTDKQTPYHPGTFSPGFWAVTVNDTVSALANAPVGAMYKTFLASDNPDTATADKNLMSCDRYLAALRSKYLDTYGADPLQRTSATVPMVLDSIWSASGLQAYKRIQFGDGRYADNAYCHWLDISAGIPVTYAQRVGQAQTDPNGGGADIRDDYSVQEVLNTVRGGLGDQLTVKVGKDGLLSGSTSGINTQAANELTRAHSPAWNPQGNVEEDAAIVAWAACRVTGTDLASDSSYDGAHAAYLVQPGGLPDVNANIASSAVQGAVNSVTGGFGYNLLRLPGRVISGVQKSEQLTKFRTDPSGYSATACKQMFTTPDYAADEFNWGNQSAAILRETASAPDLKGDAPPRPHQPAACHGRDPCWRNGLVELQHHRVHLQLARQCRGLHHRLRVQPLQRDRIPVPDYTRRPRRADPGTTDQRKAHSNGMIFDLGHPLFACRPRLRTVAHVEKWWASGV